jgi:GT2 family glycosyltransferase
MITPKENRGAAHARNRLAAEASCPWIHFHDVDDEISPRFIEAMASRLNGDVDVAICQADWVWEDSRAVMMKWRYAAGDFARDPIAAAFAHPISVNSAVFRREPFLSAGGFDEGLRMWEDAELHLRLARQGARYAVCEEVLSVALRHDDSFSHDYRENANWRLRVLEKHEAPLRASHAVLLAAEAEETARELLRHGDPAAARRAVALALRAGGSPPTTRNRILRLLKPWLPRLWLLRLQLRGRRA